jgi:hypothetical protein
MPDETNMSLAYLSISNCSGKLKWAAPLEKNNK